MNTEFNFETNFEYHIEIVTNEGYGEQITYVILANESDVEEFHELIADYKAAGFYLRHEIL